MWRPNPKRDQCLSECSSQPFKNLSLCMRGIPFLLKPNNGIINTPPTECWNKCFRWCKYQSLFKAINFKDKYM